MNSLLSQPSWKLWIVPFYMLGMCGLWGNHILERPIPSKGPGATTLLIYSSSRPPYALFDGVDLMALQLGRVHTKTTPRSMQDVTAEEISLADYVVIYCPTPEPKVSPPVLNHLNAAQGPVLWVGFGLAQLQDLNPFFEAFITSSPASSANITNLFYRNRVWPITPWPVINVSVPSNSVAKVHMSIPSESSSTLIHPVAWTFGRTTFFAGLPHSFETEALFGDLILDFYNVLEVSPSHLCVCIENYHPGSNHAAFQRKVDYLLDHKINFVVSAIPAFENPVTGEVQDLEARPDFAASLRYAQRRGGRIVLGGFVYRPENPFEFWNEKLDRPLAEAELEPLSEQLPHILEQLISQGLYPLAWKTPQDSASLSVREKVAEYFSMTLGKIQLSDATRLDNYTASGLFQDTLGVQVIPENLGTFSLSASNQWALLDARANLLLGLRGTLVGCGIPDYLPFEEFTALIEWLESHNTPFLDIALLDLWTQWPGGLLITGGASKTATPPVGSIRWKAFDSSGDIFNEFTEPNVSPRERIFRNRGTGSLELYEFLKREP